MTPKQLLITVLATLLVGCSSLTPKQQLQVSQMDGCDKLSAVISQSQLAFAELKGPEVGGKFMRSWQAKAHLVGNQCQIMTTASGVEKYLCLESFADYDHAVEMLQYGDSLVTQCLGSDWQKQLEWPLPKYRSRYHSSQKNATVSLSLSQSLSKSAPWQLTLAVTASNSK